MIIYCFNILLFFGSWRSCSGREKGAQAVRTYANVSRYSLIVVVKIEIMDRDLSGSCEYMIDLVDM